MKEITFKLRRATKEEISKSDIKTRSLYNKFYKITVEREEEEYSIIVTPNFPVSELVKSVKEYFNLL